MAVEGFAEEEASVVTTAVAVVASVVAADFMVAEEAAAAVAGTVAVAVAVAAVVVAGAERIFRTKGRNMKINIPLIFGTALTTLAGCTSTSVTLAPVGPDALAQHQTGTDGQLEVYSAWVGRSEGNNPSWEQHSSYKLFDSQGKKLERVENSVGRYERRPRTLDLPPGKYIVEAQAAGGQPVTVPVIIATGKMTAVHLDSGSLTGAASSPRKL